MQRNSEENSSIHCRRRRTRSPSSSPEPYRERRRSKKRRRTYSRGSDSRSRDRDNIRSRYTQYHKESGRDRSSSPRRRAGRGEGGEASHRSGPGRRRDEGDERHSIRSHRSSPPRPSRGLKQYDKEKDPSVKGSKALPSQQDAFKGEPGSGTPPVEKQKANYATTGRLAAESNTINSADGQAIILKYHEPPEARKPPPGQAWRIYVFKGTEIMDTIELSQRSCWLFGREAAVVDFLVEHPSCSKQHAVVQFRYVEKRNEFGDKMGKVKPYVIDLESANGTSMNSEEVPAGRYLELRDKDILKFGHSSREYVLQLPP
jgi:smad nuclear-interacting protein 1